MTQLYLNIQNLRKARNIKSVRKLEQLCDISEGTIKKWKERYPGCELLMKVAKFFDVSTDYLLGISEEQKNPNASKIVNELSILKIDDRTTDLVIEILRVISRNLNSDN